MPTSTKYSLPGGALPPFPTTSFANSDTRNSKDNYFIDGLNTLDDDVNRLEQIIGIAADAIEAGITFTSTRVISNAADLITNLSALDAAVLLTGNTVTESVDNLTGTVSTVDGTKTFTVDAGTDVVTCTSHSLATAQPFQVQTTGSLPGGLASGTTYYAGTTTTNTFKVYPTSADASAETNAVNITSTGSGTHSLNGAILHGDGTSFTSETIAGQWLNISSLGGNPNHKISSVDSNTQITLAAEVEETSNGNNFKELHRITDTFVFEEAPVSENDALYANELVRKSQFDPALLYPPGFFGGPPPYWASASTVVIPAGFKCLDSTGAYNIDVTSNITVDLSASGANGLDNGGEATSTWYSLYVIDDSTGVNTPKGVFSTTNESVSGSITLPSGYDIKRQIRIFWYNNSSGDLMDQIVGSGWPHRPSIEFAGIAFNGNGQSGSASPTEIVSQNSSNTSFTDLTVTYMPASSRLVRILMSVGNISTVSDLTLNVREKGDTSDGVFIDCHSSDGKNNVLETNIRTNTSQQLQYKIGSVNMKGTIVVKGYTITEMNN